MCLDEPSLALAHPDGHVQAAKTAAVGKDIAILPDFYRPGATSIHAEPGNPDLINKCCAHKGFNFGCKIFDKVKVHTFDWQH